MKINGQHVEAGDIINGSVKKNLIKSGRVREVDAATGSPQPVTIAVVPSASVPVPVVEAPKPEPMPAPEPMLEPEPEPEPEPELRTFGRRKKSR